MPAGPKVPDGFYTLGDTIPADKTLKSPSSLQGAPAGPNDAKTVVPPAPGGDGTLAKKDPGSPTLPAGPGGDPALGKTDAAAPAPPSPPDADKTPVAAAPQFKAAKAEIAGSALAKPHDIDVLDPSNESTAFAGVRQNEKGEWVSDKSRAPMGSIPEEDEPGVTGRQYLYAAQSAALAKNKPGMDYVGSWVELPKGRFKLVDAPRGWEGTSVKFLIEDTTTGQRYLFKPASGEPPLQAYGHRAQGRTLFVRGAVAARMAQELNMGDSVPMVTVVVHEGRVGSLQPWIENSISLDALERADNALYQKVMNDDPGFKKWRSNLRAYDHIINNSDRDMNPGNIMLELSADKKTVVKYYGIDQEAVLAPGAKHVAAPGNTLHPRYDLNASWTDPNNPVIGKISKSLYNQMRAMIANEASVRTDWKRSYGLNDAALDGVFGRMREVVVDFQDRLAKSNNIDSAVFYVD